MKRAVIVGGGYAGVTLARALDESFDVVLLERRDCFYHNVGAMRAYADATYFERLLIPYNRLLRRGRVVQDEAVEVVDGGVRGSAGYYEADLVVVASGSRHRMPFKSSFTQVELFLREANRLSAELAEAESVEIVGDGPVAVELAGEICWRFPRKRVKLSARGTHLLAGAGNPKLGDRAAEMLRAMGVTVTFGGCEAGAELRIDGFGAEFGVPCLGSQGRVPVDSLFQVAGLKRVFAIGDAAECGDPPLTFLARRQALHLASQLLGRKGGYRPAARVPMAVPLGLDRGVMQLPLPGLPVVGSWLTARIKGRGLFVAENWVRLGWPSPRM